MRMEFTPEARVDLETAKTRAETFLRSRPRNREGRRIPYPAGIIADYIWPNHQMHSQGAGGAASRILKQMPNVEWTTDCDKWGWRLKN